MRAKSASGREREGRLGHDEEEEKGRKRIREKRQADGQAGRLHLLVAFLLFYKIRHFFLPLPSFLVSSAARVACSKTSRTPSLVRAEHSRYL